MFKTCKETYLDVSLQFSVPLFTTKFYTLSFLSIILQNYDYNINYISGSPK